MPKFTNIPKQFQAYQDELHQAAKAVIDSGWYIFGDRLEEFEQSFAAYCQTKYCIGVGSGFDALQLTLMAFQELGKLQEGDEVLVPANTFVATALAVTRNGLKLRLADPNPHSFNLDAAEVSQWISTKTKAIIPVHLYGRIADLSAAQSILEDRDILVLEDAAQAHGAKLYGKCAGQIGAAAAFSFYPVKNLGAVGDSGAIVTDDEELASILRKLRNYGGDKYRIDYQGINSRMSELQAALLSVKLKYLDIENKRRKEIANQYLNKITNKYIQLPLVNDGHEVVWHQFVLKSSHRDLLKAYLAQTHIASLIHYPIPIHRQVAYPELNQLSFPVSEQLSNEILSIPIAPHLENQEIDKIIEQINSFEPK